VWYNWGPKWYKNYNPTVEVRTGSEIALHKRVIKEGKDISLNLVVSCVILY
jgi:hypothetical protein